MKTTETTFLLTAKPKKLQKFVVKYVNSEEAFKEGVDATLVKLSELND